MYDLVDNMIGGYYPFFITNEPLGEIGYIYQAGSPTYSRATLLPYFSLTKVCNRTFPTAEGEKPISRDTDVLFDVIDEQYKNSLRDEKGNLDRNKINWIGQVKRAIGNKAIKVIPSLQKEGFPLIEINGEDIEIQKNLILNLRSGLKWRKYSIKPGNMVDVLWTRTTFLVCEIGEKEDKYFLIPRGLYKNTDICLKNNLLKGNMVLNKEFSKKPSEFIVGLKYFEASFLERPEAE